MNKRHQNTERVGVYRVGGIIEEDFEWIFREQPIADVGIDALVEKSTNGEPSGKFLALQIKAGEGNVYERKKEKEYVYYISNVHYYYWTNLSMPVLLVCYLPKNKKLYWVEVNRSNCIRTTKGWKVAIPYENVFDKRAYNKINRIVVGGKGNMSSISIGSNDSIYNVGHLDLVNDSLNVLVFITTNHNERIQAITQSLTILVSEVESLSRTQQLEVYKFSLITAFDILASRLFNEIDIFSKAYAKWITSTKSNYILMLKQDGVNFVENELKSISNMSEAFSHAIEGMSAMRQPIQDLEKDNILSDISTLNKAEIAITIVILNLSQAQHLGRTLVSEVKVVISKE